MSETLRGKKHKTSPFTPVWWLWRLPPQTSFQSVKLSSKSEFKSSANQEYQFFKIFQPILSTLNLKSYLMPPMTSKSNSAYDRYWVVLSLALLLELLLDQAPVLKKSKALYVAYQGISLSLCLRRKQSAWSPPKLPSWPLFSGALLPWLSMALRWAGCIISWHILDQQMPSKLIL